MGVCVMVRPATAMAKPLSSSSFRNSDMTLLFSRWSAIFFPSLLYPLLIENLGESHGYEQAIGDELGASCRNGHRLGECA